MQDPKFIIMQLLSVIPFVVVVGAALLIALIKYRQCPSAYLWLIIGSVILLIERAMSFLFYSVAAPQLHQRMASTDITKLYTVASFAFGLLFIVGLGCVIVAVFAGRTKNAFVNPDAR